MGGLMASAPVKPVPASTPAADSEAAGTLSRLSELAWQALPAIGSAVGFAGFVAVIGAAIEWIRFGAAGLPAMQAVLAVPRAELVFNGALVLSMFVGGGALAVLLVYLIDNDGDATPAMVRGIVAIGVVELLVTLAFINQGAWWTYVWLTVWIAVIGLVAADLAGEVMRNFCDRVKLKHARAKVVAARDKLVAARLARDAANSLKGWPSRTKKVEAQEKAQLAFVSAQRAWEAAVREWLSASGEIESGLTDDARETLDGVRKKLSGYGNTPPDGDELDSELEKAEEGTGHVFRAVGARLREQAPALLARLMALLTKSAELLSAKKRKEAKADRLTAAADALEGTSKATASAEPASKLPPSKQAAAEVAEQERAALLARIFGVLALAAITAGIVLVAVEDLFSWFTIVVVAVVLLTTMNVFVARATEKFAWYGVSVFFSVLVFGATLMIAWTLNDPKAQPIAVLRNGDSVGICGVYIAQTSDRVYIGRRPAGRRPGVVFWIPTKEVDLMSVGHSEKIKKGFKEHAEAMLLRLEKDRAEAAAPTLKNETITEVERDRGTGKRTTRNREEFPPPSSTPAPSSSAAQRANPCP
jgi:hypothetical protein